MIDSFKNYINTLLCLGIFVTILQLIIPKNNSKKYIYSLVGLIIVISIITPMVNLLKNENIESGVEEVLSNFDKYKSENTTSDVITQDVNSNLVKDQVIANIKEDIQKKMNEKGISANNIEIYLEDNYEIKKIRLHINKVNDNNKVFNNINEIVVYIKDTYNLEYEKIEVVEE